MNTRFIVAFPALFLSAAVMAQTMTQPGNINAVKIEPVTAQINQPVKITVTTEGEPQTNCGLRINFGDGEVREIKIASDHSQFPVTVNKTYTKAGNFVVKARGTTINMRGRCQGEAETKVTVAAATPVPTAASANCPEGYKLKGKVGKAGDFTCTAEKGAKKPEKVLECKEGLEYFQSKSSLGCRKAATK